MANRVRNKQFRRVRTPSVLQMEATECGAASLAIILAYYGRYVPLDELRMECRVSRDGSNALYVKKTAEKYGLSGKGYQMTTEALRGLPPPFMVFWDLNHFLVVEGMEHDRVYLNDPASGRRSVNLDEFTESYAGIVFRFEPAPGFRAGGPKPSTWRAIARRLGGAYSAVAFAVMAGVALMAAELVATTFNPLFVDQILVAERRQWIRPLLLAMGLTLLFRVATGFLQLGGLRRLKRSLAATHSARFVWHVLRLPTDFYQQRYAGDIASRVDSNSAVADLVSGPLATTLVGVLMVVIYGGVMLAFDPVLALVGVALGALNMAGIAAVQRLLADENIKVKHFSGLLAGSMMHAVQIIETLKAGASEHEALVRVTGNQARLTNASQRVTTVAGLLVVLPPLLSLVTTAAVLGLGGSHVIDGLMSVGALVAFQALLTQFNRPFGDLVGLGSSVQTLQAELARLDDVEQHRTDPVFDSAPLAPGLTGRGPPRRLSGRLEFRDVTFGFNRTLGEPLIKRFSLTIRPGSRVALVGLSGSGKSTIGRLTAGLLRPWEGEILYDGFSIDEIPRAVFTDQVGLVDDHTLLFSGTIRENLTLWDDAVADREVSRAAMDAGIHRDVVRLRHGYSARLSEGARNLSGGQRQRMEIGRALVRNPALLILDEATSALDPVTEALVDDNLRRRGCTCLIIAHRLSTIRDCEEIIVLQQGKVIERGTHDELMTDAGGFYAQLQALQDGACASRCAAPGRSEQQIAVPVSASVNATLREGVPYANGHTDQSAVLKGISDSIARAQLPAVATAVATIEAQRPADLDEALARIGDVVTAAGNQPLPLDDVGSVWRVTSGQVDVFYLRPEPGQDRGRRRHVCRVEEGGSIFGLEGARSGEQGDLRVVGVGPARLFKVSKADLLRLSLDSDWRRDVAALIDNWVDRLSRAASTGDPPSTIAFLEPDEPHQAAAGGRLTARREVVWIRPGSAGIRFIDRVSVPTCAHESRFPLSPHTWISCNQAETIQACDTQTLIENGDPWEGLKRFHQVLLDAIAAALSLERAEADARRESASRRDVAMVSTALTRLCLPDRPGLGRAVSLLPAPDALAETDLFTAACRAVGAAQGIEVASPRLDGVMDPLRAIARASGFRTRRIKLTARWWSQDGTPMLGRRADDRRPVALIPDSLRRYVLVDPVRNTRVRVTGELARTLQPIAVVFYRTLSSDRSSLGGFVRFALPLIRGELWTLAVMGLICGLLGLVVPIVTAVAIDEAIPRADRRQLDLLCAFLVAVALAVASFQAIQTVALARLRGKLESSLLPAFWDRLLSLPVRFFAQYEAGDLALRALGPARLIDVLASTTTASMLVSIFALFNMAALFVLNWRLGLVAAGLMGVFLLVTAAALRPLWVCQREISKLRGEIAGLLFLLLGGISRLRVAGAEPRAFARWATRYQEQLRQSLRFQMISGRLVLFGEVWPIAVLMVILASAVFGSAFLSIGEFLAFNASLMLGLAAVVSLGKGAISLIDGLRECERFAPILVAAPEVNDACGELVRLGGAIRLDNVSFRYTPAGPLILDSVNFQVRPGEFVAVVGPSGSGKSTLLRLLLGFESPTEGSVSYDGRELTTLDVHEVRRQIGVVLQDARLRPGDIFSNIVGLSTHLTRDDAWAAAELAGLADDIEQMPMGIHTVVSEGGSGLSSGQRQRLIIARALAGQPKVLLFDEATSALDNRTQAHVSHSIHVRLRGTTRVAIAHRLSTVIDADRIYVLSGGMIVQSGRYAQLIAEPGPFQDLARRQMLAQTSDRD
jgi:NHLM bacteriocin system ABC transporter peptidase/ATP-binding protein/NHLM bacteriocin system ABC transporter ATP-binding protein